MTSEYQVLANRQNALKSTGPNSNTGKAIASQNSIKHGILSKHILARDENGEDLDDFFQGVYATLKPEGSIEILLVEKIVNASWRLQRLSRVEVAIMNERDFHLQTEHLRNLFWGNTGTSLQALSRYESALERNLYKAIHELQRIQAARLGIAVMAPIAIEITNSTRE